MIRLHTVNSQQPKTIIKPAQIKKNSPAAPAPVVAPAPAPAPVVAPAPAPAPVPTPVITPSPSSSVGSLAPTTTTTSTTSTTTTTTTPTTISYTSTNWSGYLVTGDKYSDISASWVATNPTGNNTTTTADATWVGIGGVTTSDLIQVGTENSVSASGQVSTAAFYEMLPNASINIDSLKISPGDSISASLAQVSTGQWTISITDVTTNHNFTLNVSYTSMLSSAEWIEEDPSNLSNSLIPFDNFGVVPFSGASTTVNGTSITLSGAKADSITMLNSTGQNIAVPSAISSTGSSFSITRTNFN